MLATRRADQSAGSPYCITAQAAGGALGGRGGGRRRVLDLDNFKRINTHYHGFGDQLLKAVALAISGCWPRTTLARLGGDEFIVLQEGAEVHELGATRNASSSGCASRSARG